MYRKNKRPVGHEQATTDPGILPLSAAHTPGNCFRRRVLAALASQGTGQHVGSRYALNVASPLLPGRASSGTGKLVSDWIPLRYDDTRRPASRRRSPAQRQNHRGSFSSCAGCARRHLSRDALSLRARPEGGAGVEFSSPIALAEGTLPIAFRAEVVKGELELGRVVKIGVAPAKGLVH